MQINIGQIIREELRRQGHTNEWLAERIHVHPRTVQKIFLKSTIDTQQLLAISQAMHVDFFNLFTQYLTDRYCNSVPINKNDFFAIGKENLIIEPIAPDMGAVPVSGVGKARD